MPFVEITSMFRAWRYASACRALFCAGWKQYYYECSRICCQSRAPRVYRIIECNPLRILESSIVKKNDGEHHRALHQLGQIERNDCLPRNNDSWLPRSAIFGTHNPATRKLTAMRSGITIYNEILLDSHSRRISL